jgi:hypothetical protein
MMKNSLSINAMKRFHRTPRNHALRFGRRQPFALAMPTSVDESWLGDDVRLFATAFIGGLLFMSVYLA